MKIEQGYEGTWFAVFKNEDTATKWEWLFWHVLRRTRHCFGGYYNAYQLFGRRLFR